MNRMLPVWLLILGIAILAAPPTALAQTVDTDGDGVPDINDSDPLDPFVCADTDSDTCDDCSVAGFFDPANDGTDTDSDGICDASDTDDDNDGVEDINDLDPLNPFVCGDFDGDLCEDCISGTFDVLADGPGADGDGFCDTGDNCPQVPNPDQADADFNGVGDACEAVPVKPSTWGTVKGRFN